MKPPIEYRAKSRPLSDEELATVERMERADLIMAEYERRKALKAAQMQRYRARKKAK